MIEVTINGPGQPAKSYRFDAARILIGRDTDCDIAVDNPACSRRHAEIVSEGAGHRLRDLASSNGVFVGSRRVTDVALSDGAAFNLGGEGGITLVYLRVPEPQAAAPQTAAPQVLMLTYPVKGGLKNLKVAAGVEYVVGRSPEADVVLDDSKASKQHCLIHSRGGRFYLKDLGSANGTYLGGERVDEVELVPDSKILVGTTRMTVQLNKVDLADQAALLDGTVFAELASLAPAAARGSSASPAAVPRRGSPRLLVAGLAVLLIATIAGYLLLVRTSSSGGTAVREVAGASVSNEAVVQVVAVAEKELVFSIAATGAIKPVSQVTVSTEVAGRLLEVTVQDNAQVARGDLLATVNDRDLRLQIDQARSSLSPAQVNLAREDFERKQRLFEDDVITRSVYESAQSNYLALKAGLDSIEAKVRQLQEQITKTRIRAPISGVVLKKHVNVGEVVAPGTPIVTLANVDQVLLEAEVPDRDVVNLARGQAAEATSDAYPGRVFAGAIDKIASAANPVTRTFRVEALLANDDHLLKSGMIAALRMIQERGTVVVVPLEAVIGESAGQPAVFTIAGATAHRTEVRLGRRVDRDVEVLSGLAAGDQVVVFGQEDLRDGQPVRVEGGRSVR